MSNATQEITNAIHQTTNFSALETLSGMNAGFFTSPLIKDYGFQSLMVKFKDADQALISQEIKLQKRAVNEVRESHTVKVGTYNIGGMVVDQVKQKPISPETVAIVRQELSA